MSARLRTLDFIIHEQGTHRRSPGHTLEETEASRSEREWKDGGTFERDLGSTATGLSE